MAMRIPRCHLTRALVLVSCISAVASAQTDAVVVRLIVVHDDSTAQSLSKRLDAGEPFSRLALQYSADSSATLGGYVGVFRLEKLPPDIQFSVLRMPPGTVALAHAGTTFRLLQYIAVSADVRAFLDSMPADTTIGSQLDDLVLLDKLEVKAQHGDAESQNNLGYAFAHGHVVQQDYQQALLWYRRSADQGYAP